MSFANETPLTALPVPLLDHVGQDVLTCIVKATWRFGDNAGPKLAEEQAPVRVIDEPYRPDDPRSSLRFPSDVCVEKLGSDVVVVGDAIAPRPVKQLDIAVMVKDRVVPAVVHGPRVYYDAVVRVSVGPAQPFERWPVVYEYAYGGMVDDLSVFEPRNPSGVGVAKRAADVVGTRAPQIVHPAGPIEGPPAGFGAIPSHWSPRRELVGTVDERWRRYRMPLPPEDYDRRFANVANPTLQFAEGLSAGDPLRVLGMSLTPFICVLPPLPCVVRARFDGGQRVELRPRIDTVLAQPEHGLVEVTGRVALPTGRNDRILREVVVRSDD